MNTKEGLESWSKLGLKWYCGGLNMRREEQGCVHGGTKHTGQNSALSDMHMSYNRKGDSNDCVKGPSPTSQATS